MKKYFEKNKWTEKHEKYLDKWDASDIIPTQMLREIRASERYVNIEELNEFDNTNPANCEVRLKGFLKVRSGRNEK
jgi:hypothetical protein